MHASALHYTRQHDFPRRSGKPRIQLMIASVPRSGSTAFCLDLWRTGLLGSPLEYANLNLMQRQLRWRKILRHELRFWRHLQSIRTGPNGVFSYKFFVLEYPQIQARAPRLLPEIAPSHVVYFTRQDKLEQAISYSRALRSGIWFANADTEEQPSYDRQDIDDRLRSIRDQEANWEQVFRCTATRPLRLTYEDFLQHPTDVVDQVLDYVLGTRARGPSLDIPGIERQRDAASEELRRRYLSDLERLT